MSPRRHLTGEAARRLAERERAAGLDPDDEAARWLAEHDAAPPPAPSKSSRKLATFHRWQRRQSGR
jgi:hypothetical protein